MPSAFTRGRLTEPADAFDHPFWDHIRVEISKKAVEVRRQGFSGPAMLGMNELEYTGVVETPVPAGGAIQRAGRSEGLKD